MWKNYTKTKKTIFTLLVFVVGGTVGAGATVLWYKLSSQLRIADQVSILRYSDPRYPLVKRLLTVDFSDRVIFPEFDPIKTEVEKIINKYLAEKKLDDIAVYFRDLETGHWVGIKTDELFSPASLFKVPVMMSYLKKAETDPDILKQKVKYEHVDSLKVDPNQTEIILQEGQEYTVDDLIHNMIVNSDNASFVLLLKVIDPQDLEQLFRDLEIDFPQTDKEQQYQISAKTYSIFFRILRSATYLNRAMSEKALELLSQTTFKDGIVAGVPKDVAVAHKFGLNTENKDGQTEIELHDCGIVYTKINPYFLCMMTKGSNGQNLKASMKEISEYVYGQVVQQ